MKLFLNSLRSPTYSSPDYYRMIADDESYIDTLHTLDFTDSFVLNLRYKGVDDITILQQEKSSGVSALILGNFPSNLGYWDGAFFGTKGNIFDNNWHDIVLNFISDGSFVYVRLFVDGIFNDESNPMTVSSYGTLVLNAKSLEGGRSISSWGDCSFKEFFIKKGAFTDNEAINIDDSNSFISYKFNEIGGFETVNYGSNGINGNVVTYSDVNKLRLNSSGNLANKIDFTYHVIGVIGQSNTGYGWGYDFSIDTGYPNIKQWGAYTPNVEKVCRVVHPMDGTTFYHQELPSDRISFSYHFARRYVDEGYLTGINDQVLIVFSGEGSTGFHNGYWGVGNICSEYYIERMNKLQSLLPNLDLKVTLWHQGEGDSTYDDPIPYYQNALFNMMDDYINRISLVKSNTPFVIGQLSPKWVDEREGNTRELDEWFKDIDTVRNHMACASPYLPTLVDETNYDVGAPGGQPEIIHYSANSHRILGYFRYWTAFLESKSNN